MKRPPEHKFSIRHQAKQRLLLIALNRLEFGPDEEPETPAETAAIVEMINRLEALISRRQRLRLLGETVEERLRAMGRRRNA